MPRLPELVTQPDDFLILPIAGRDGVVREYTIPPVPAEAWYRASALGEVVLLTLSNIRPRPSEVQLVMGLSKDEQYRLALSDEIVDAMIADGVAGPHLQRAFTAALMFIATGGDQEQATNVWLGKAKAPNRAARRSSKTSPRSS